MTETLRRVIYVSHLRAPPDGGAGMLDDILRASRRNNARAGVTGALLFSARRFAQVLEGPAAAVEEIFERIQCDLRHDQVTVLRVEDPPARAFPDWSMGFAPDPRIPLPDGPQDAARLIGLLQGAIRNTEAAMRA